MKPGRQGCKNTAKFIAHFLFIFDFGCKDFFFVPLGVQHMPANFHRPPSNVPGEKKCFALGGATRPLFFYSIIYGDDKITRFFTRPDEWTKFGDFSCLRFILRGKIDTRYDHRHFNQNKRDTPLQSAVSEFFCFALFE